MLHCKWKIKIKYIHLLVMSEWQYHKTFWLLLTVGYKSD